MPTVKKTDGPRGYIRALERRVRVGETYDVSRGEAEYVLEERQTSSSSRGASTVTRTTTTRTKASRGGQ